MMYLIACKDTKKRTPLQSALGYKSLCFVNRLKVNALQSVLSVTSLPRYRYFATVLAK